MEGLTSSVGDELTDFGGHRSTRLASLFLPEMLVQTGLANSANYVQATRRVTLASGTFVAGVLVGRRYRVLDGPLAGLSALIETVEDNMNIILVAPGLGVNDTGQSWEVVIDAETTMNVESVFEWSADGVVYLDGVRYRYGSRTDTTLDDIEHDSRAASPAEQVDSGMADADYSNSTRRVTITSGTFSGDVIAGRRFRVLSGDLEGLTAFIEAVEDPTNLILATKLGAAFTGESWEVEIPASEEVVFVAGAKQRHEVLAIVADYTREFSAVDITRNGIFVDTAIGVDLDIIGRRLGVPRPGALADDERYRALIKAIAYVSKGTPWSIELALEALLPGAWEWFEDMVEGSTRHPGVIYIRKLDETAEDPNGKAFLDGYDLVPMTAATTVTVSQEPLRVASVRLADEPGQFGTRIIAEGVGAISTDGGITITLASGDFSNRGRTGDLFMVLSGASSRKLGTILSVSPAPPAAATSLTIVGSTTVVRGAQIHVIGANLSRVRWRIVRPISNFRFYRPSQETYLEHPADAGTSIWTFTGTSVEATQVTLVDDAVGGQYLRLVDPNPGTVTYRHTTRIDPESEAAVEIHVRVDAIGASADGRQIAVRLRDGEREINLGAFDAAGDIDWRPMDSAGAAIGASILAVQAGDWVTFRIVKRARRGVQFWADTGSGFALWATVAHTSFGASAARNIEWGCFIDVLTGADVWVKHVDWRVTTEDVDRWNLLMPNGETPGAGSRNLIDSAVGGLYIAGDVGRRLRISNFTGKNAGGGNPIGEWEIEAFIDANELTLIGPTQQRIHSAPGQTRRLIVEGYPDAFTWPHNKGHDIEILSGPNANTYSIAKILDPVTLEDLDVQFPLTSAFLGLEASAENATNVPFTVRSNVIEIDVDLPVPTNTDEIEWRLVPVFGTDGGPVPHQVVDTGTAVAAALTLRQALPAGSGVVVAVHYSTVESAIALDATERNEFDVDHYTQKPFYLSDNWGFVRGVLARLTAAGFRANLDDLFRDDAGLHIIEEMP
jgi:hypothetical protein